MLKKHKIKTIGSKSISNITKNETKMMFSSQNTTTLNTYITLALNFSSGIKLKGSKIRQNKLKGGA